MALALRGAPAAWSADRKGTMDEDCCGTSFQLRVPHNGEKAGTAGKEIILRLSQGCPGHLPLSGLVAADWLKADATLCNGSSQCEAATAARIRLESVSHNARHASGSYSADFPNAGHAEGKFIVKYHHEGPRYICE